MECGKKGEMGTGRSARAYACAAGNDRGLGGIWENRQRSGSQIEGIQISNTEFADISFKDVNNNTKVDPEDVLTVTVYTKNILGETELIEEFIDFGADGFSISKGSRDTYSSRAGAYAKRTFVSSGVNAGRGPEVSKRYEDIVKRVFDGVK